MFKCIGLFSSNRTARGVRESLVQVCDILRHRGLDKRLDPTSVALLGEADIKPCTVEMMKQECDLVIAIGGDGTIIKVAHEIHGQAIPLLGINRGRLGFLADIPADDVAPQLNAILDGDYVEEERFMLECEARRNGNVLFGATAVNDVVIHKMNIARLVEFDTYVNDNFLLTQRSDGMIVSSPTGSTAYALSGGGPIVDSALDALVMVPICPHTLTVRPVVVEGNSVIDIVVGKRDVDQARITCDGEIIGDLLESGDCIRIKKKAEKLRLIHPAKHNHFAIIRAKLNWGR